MQDLIFDDRLDYPGEFLKVVNRFIDIIFCNSQLQEAQGDGTLQKLMIDILIKTPSVLSDTWK
jgi:hypothetical protein